MIEVIIVAYVISVLATLSMINEDLGFTTDKLLWKETQIVILITFIPLANLIMMQVAYESLTDDN